MYLCLLKHAVANKIFSANKKKPVYSVKPNTQLLKLESTKCQGSSERLSPLGIVSEVSQPTSTWKGAEGKSACWWINLPAGEFIQELGNKYTQTGKKGWNQWCALRWHQCLSSWGCATLPHLFITSLTSLEENCGVIAEGILPCPVHLWG